MGYLPVSPCHVLDDRVTAGLPGASCHTVGCQDWPPRRDTRAESASCVGGSMKRRLTVALLAIGTAAAVWATAAPAAAASGSESFHGLIIKGRTGAVITSVVVAKGVFHGVGRIVETPSRPGDPANTNRDDLVFAGG